MRRIARSSSSVVALLLVATLSGACAREAPPQAAAPGDAAARITAMMQHSAAAWSEGDLDAFVGDYAVDATFVTSRGLVHGRAAIRSLYLTAYWRDGRPRDALRYEDLDVRRVGPSTAIAFGHFVLFDRESGATRATGSFSLTFRKTGASWEIVHDHSS